jgi:hypothetical protein
VLRSRSRRADESPVDPRAAELDRARVGRVEQAHEVQQRALARAALAHDRDELAGREVEVHTPQHLERAVSPER